MQNKQRPAQNGELKVIQFTDIHFFPDSTKTLLNVNTADSFSQTIQSARSNGWPPDFVLATGDLSQDGSVSSYRHLQNKLNALNVPIYCLPGNHDRPDVMSQVLPSKHIHVQSNVVQGRWNIIMLDTSIPNETGGRFKEKDLKFIDECLSANPRLHALICFHHSPISIGSTWLDTMMIDNADAFFNVIDRHPHVRGILFGHIHQEFEAKRKNVMLMASPSSGLQFKPKSDIFQVDTTAPGYRWLTLKSSGDIESGVRRIKNSSFKPDLTSKGY